MMSSLNNSCPRCGYKKPSENSIWKSDKNICSSCGAFWKSINDADLDVGPSLENTSKRQNYLKKTYNENDRINNLSDGPNSGEQNLYSALKPKNVPNIFSWKDNFVSKITLMNSLTFGLLVLSVASLPQFGNLKEVILGEKNQFESLPVDMMTTASISKEIEKEHPLKIGNLHLMRVLRGQDVHFMVSGLVRNNTKQVANAEMMKIYLLDKSGNTVQEWFHDIDLKNVGVGKVIRFRSSQQAANRKAVSASVKLIK